MSGTVYEGKWCFSVTEWGIEVPIHRNPAGINAEQWSGIEDTRESRFVCDVE